MSLSIKPRAILKIAMANKAAAKEIADAIDAGANPIVQVITNGDTTHTPSGDAVYDALVLKENASAVAAHAKAAAVENSINGAHTDVAPSGQAVSTALGGKQASLLMNSAVTGTGGSVGQIPVAGMTATGAVVVSGLEALGAGLVLSHVVCGVGMITVYAMDVVGVPGTVAALDAKSVGYIVIKLS